MNPPSFPAGDEGGFHHFRYTPHHEARDHHREEAIQEVALSITEYMGKRPCTTMTDPAPVIHPADYHHAVETLKELLAFWLMVRGDAPDQGMGHRFVQEATLGAEGGGAAVWSWDKNLST